jgi:hypothetical protein
LAAGVGGIMFSYYQYVLIARTTIKPQPTTESSSLRMLDPRITENLFDVYTAISEGAETFLNSEYKICGAFVVCFAALLFALIATASSVAVRVNSTLYLCSLCTCRVSRRVYLSFSFYFQFGSLVPC